MTDLYLPDQPIKHESSSGSPRGSPRAASPVKRTRSTRSGPSTRRTRRNDDNDDDYDPQLPMPHGGGGAQAEEAEDDVAMVHIEHPMWTELWRDVGQRPVASKKDCFGCRYGTLNIPTLPFEGFTTLAQQLPGKIQEHGMFAAVMWADQFYRDNVLRHISAPPEIMRSMQFSGASSVWHFCKHTQMAQFREVAEEAELTYEWDDLTMNQTYVVPAFGAGGPLQRRIDPLTVRTKAAVRQMLHRQRNVDPKKRITFHQGLGSTSAANTVPLASESYTGKGPLNARRK